MSLKALAGSYGERSLRLEEGSLLYRRRGGDPYRLTAIGGGVFALAGEAGFRIRVETDSAGRGERIVDLYLGGGEDGSEEGLCYSSLDRPGSMLLKLS